MKIEPVFLEKINVSNRLRQLDEAVVVSLVESMKHLGQLYPITIYSPNENEVHLVTGAHRVEAAKRLGWDDIAAIFVTDNEIDREMQEIAENLHRAELTALERDTQIGRWAELTAAKGAQIAPPSGGHQPQEKGVKKVARDLGIERTDVQRAIKVASISDEAKQAARDVGLDDNRTALLQVAKEATPEAQVAKVDAISVARAAKAFRERLPTRAEANKIARKQEAVTGAGATHAVLGKDGNYHSGATDGERGQSDLYLRMSGVLRSVIALGDVRAEASIASVSPQSRSFFPRLLEDAGRVIANLEAEWDRVRPTATLVGTPPRRQSTQGPNPAYAEPREQS